MQESTTIVASNGCSVRVARRNPRDSRRTAARSPDRVEQECPPAPLVGPCDLEQIASLVRRLTVRDEASSDLKIDLQRMIGRLKKRFA